MRLSPWVKGRRSLVLLNRGRTLLLNRRVATCRSNHEIACDPIALTAILRFLFVLTATLCSNTACTAEPNATGVKGLTSTELPLYASTHCHLTLQVTERRMKKKKRRERWCCCCGGAEDDNDDELQSERKTKQQTAMINDKNSQRKARLGRSAAPAPSALSRRHCSVAPTQTLAGSFTPDCRSHWCSLTLNWIEHHWRMGKTKSQDASRG